MTELLVDELIKFCEDNYDKFWQKSKEAYGYDEEFYMGKALAFRDVASKIEELSESETEN